jgi:hypothetical protein
MQRFFLLVAAIATVVACADTFEQNPVPAPPGSNARPPTVPDPVSNIGQSDSVASGSTSRVPFGR